jgi:hypothetical protein
MVSWKFEFPPSMMTSPCSSDFTSSAIVSSTGLPAGTMIQTTRRGRSWPTTPFRSRAGVAPSFAYFSTTSAARSYATTW